jgi:MraZ protein
VELGFFDQLTSKVDAKGRVSLPAAHRAVLASGDPDCVDGKNPQMILVHSKSHEQCARGFTLKAYKKIRKKISKMPYGAEKDEAVKALIQAATLVQVDDNGRMILRKDIRERFQIGAQAVFVGSDDHLQIWDHDIYYSSLDDVGEGKNPFVLLNPRTEA